MKDIEHAVFERANKELLSLIPNDEFDRVLSSEICDIDPTFLGFVGQYKNLSEIIPNHYTVVDLGCAYAPQSYFFTYHKQYIAVDVGSDIERFKTPNMVLFIKTIQNFIQEDLPRLNLDMDTTFAICSYVPPWGGDNMKMVRDTFKNVFTYYPAGTPGTTPKKFIHERND